MNAAWQTFVKYRKIIAVTSIPASAAILHQRSSTELVDNEEVVHHFPLFVKDSIIRLAQLRRVLDHVPLPVLYTASCKGESSSNEFIADAAEIAMPAVVSIEVSHQNQYFPMIQEGSGSGSGFVVDSKNGYIITNEHVVSGARNVTVVLGDGSQVSGSVVAIDGKTDLALIKVTTSKHLPEIQMGDESKLRLGQWVVAIGNSLQFPNTVTAGIVSGVARNLLDNKLFGKGMGNANQINKIANSTFVQTDTTINPGNSGGPLINLAGEVIAVNTLTLFGMARGISFSIPISEVKRFLSEVSGRSHPSVSTKTNYVLGIRMISLSSDMIAFLRHNGRLDPSVRGGVFVHDTYRNSPASKANLTKGDVIVAINNSEIFCRDDLIKGIEKSKGNTVSLTIFRPFHGFMVVKIKPAPVNDSFE